MEELEKICSGCRSGNECEQRGNYTHSSEEDNKNYGRYDQGKKRRQYH